MILPFDKIYILHLVENPERLESIKKELSKYNIENKYEIWWAVKHPHITEIVWNLKNNNKFTWNGYGDGSAFNCTREHYNIIKQAYYRGFNSICIIEDDFQFKDNYNIISRFLTKPLPNDWNIIRYGYYYVSEYINNNDITSELSYIKQEYNNNNWSTVFYALNKKGMKYYIDYMDKNYGVADLPLFYAHEHCNCYMSSKSLFKFTNEFKSDIQ